MPIAAAFGDPSMLPGAGDLLAAVRHAQSEPEDYGAGGNLPESDTLSPELLAALAAAPAQPTLPGTGAGPLATVPPGPIGIPGVMLDAYIRAEQALAVSHPQCGLHWSVLAAIGRIESSHARGGAVDSQGTTVQAILGPQLSGGPGIAAIPDSDGGSLDGDTTWDRAVGPMQFIPTTWARYAADGNGDGTASPHNIYDATLAAGRYLCADGGDLRDPVQLARAIFRYNHSDAYVANVLSWAAAYAAGVTPIESTPLPIGAPGAEQPGTTPPGTTPPGSTPPGTTTSPTSTTRPSTTSPTTTTPSTTPPTTEPTCPTAPPTTTEPSTTPPPPGCETTTTPPPPPPPTTTEPPATTSDSSPASTPADETTTQQSAPETSTGGETTTQAPSGDTTSTPADATGDGTSTTDTSSTTTSAITSVTP